MLNAQGAGSCLLRILGTYEMETKLRKRGKNLEIGPVGGLVLLGLFAVGIVSCSRPAPRPPMTACTTGPRVLYGFDDATVGSNELPIAVLCGAALDSLAQLASSRFQMEFIGPGTTSEHPVRGKVEYREGARVVGSGDRQLSYDYVIHACFDRPGTWLMRYEVDVPGAPLAKSGRDFVVHVKDAETANAKCSHEEKE